MLPIWSLLWLQNNSFRAWEMWCFVSGSSTHPSFLSFIYLHFWASFIHFRVNYYEVSGYPLDRLGHSLPFWLYPAMFIQDWITSRIHLSLISTYLYVCQLHLVNSVQECFHQLTEKLPQMDCFRYCTMSCSASSATSSCGEQQPIKSASDGTFNFHFFYNGFFLTSVFLELFEILNGSWCQIKRMGGRDY